MTAWDTRPKVGPAPNEREERDTDIADLAPSGEHEVHVDTDDDTPPDGPFAIRQVLKQLKKFNDGFEEMKGHCRSAATSALSADQTVKQLRSELQELKKEHGDRLVRLELDRLWVPRVVSTIALLISLATAYFVFAKLY